MNSRSAAGNSNRTDTSALKPRPLGLKLLTLILALLAAAALSEAVLRLFFRQNFFDFQDERTLLYRYDKLLGWFPLAGSKDRLLGSRVISVAHNRHGFRAPEWSPLDPRRPGILFLGDSYVWGYDVEADERFTEKLQARHPEWTHRKDIPLFTSKSSASYRKETLWPKGESLITGWSWPID